MAKDKENRGGETTTDRSTLLTPARAREISQYQSLVVEKAAANTDNNREAGRKKGDFFFCKTRSDIMRKKIVKTNCENNKKRTDGRTNCASRLTLKRLETRDANTCCGPLNPSPASASRGGSSPTADLSAASSCDVLIWSPFPMSTSSSGHAA